MKATRKSVATYLNPGVNYDRKVRQQLRLIYRIRRRGSAFSGRKIDPTRSPAAWQDMSEMSALSRSRALSRRRPGLRNIRNAWMIRQSPARLRPVSCGRNPAAPPAGGRRSLRPRARRGTPVVADGGSPRTGRRRGRPLVRTGRSSRKERSSRTVAPGRPAVGPGAVRCPPRGCSPRYAVVPARPPVAERPPWSPCAADRAAGRRSSRYRPSRPRSSRLPVVPVPVVAPGGHRLPVRRGRRRVPVVAVPSAAARGRRGPRSSQSRPEPAVRVEPRSSGRTGACPVARRNRARGRRAPRAARSGRRRRIARRRSSPLESRRAVVAVSLAAVPPAAAAARLVARQRVACRAAAESRGRAVAEPVVARPAVAVTARAPRPTACPTPGRSFLASRSSGRTSSETLPATVDPGRGRPGDLGEHRPTRRPRRPPCAA